MAKDYFWIELGASTTVAIPLDKTREVVSFTLNSLCLIPGVRPELLGVSNQRGNLLWVIDLPRLLAPTTAMPLNYRSLENTKAVVLTGASTPAAAIVKGLRGIISFDPGQLVPSQDPFFLAHGSQDGESIPILAVDQVFAWFQSGSAGNVPPLLAT